MSYFAFANLDDAALSQVKSLETKLGKPLVALREVELQPAKIDDSTLSEIKSLEEQLDVALVAVVN